MQPEPRIAILVSIPVSGSLRNQVAEGVTPQRDFFALETSLNARLILPFARNDASETRSPSSAARIFKSARAAFKARDTYDTIITDLERPGLMLAALFKTFGVRNKRHIMVCHGKLLQRADQAMFRAARLEKYVDVFLCYGPAIAERLAQSLRLAEERVAVVRHPVDHRFWSPRPDITQEKLIVSAGMFMRDYPVLIEAMAGLDTCLEIAAYSPWVKQRAATGIDGAGERVRTVRHGYPGMRDAYARALAVAIPLRETPIQAGSLVLYEAMAMSKPVIATRTEGLERLGVLQHGETGLFVAPGDTKGWRAAVGHLTSNPNEAARMGQNARAIVDHGLNLDAYATQMGRLVNEDRIEIA